ncbi:MAG: DUF1698 domain-containing protein [Phycisphaerales bacterium]|jgi:tRNA (mo5U34)-methyltransferase
MDLQERINAEPYWYHRIELPAGIVTPGWAPIDPARYCVPENLSGMRVLDIGAWDGYWTWEALKRGAKEVVAIDDFSDTCGAPDRVKRNGWKTFDICREAFGFNKLYAGGSDVSKIWQNGKNQTVHQLTTSIYDVIGLGKFDIIFFFGTIYHLKHPLMALEGISRLCKGALYVETASLDEYSPYRGGIGQGYDRNDMVMEFYPTNQYGNNSGNWWAPTLQCLGAMMETVGFKDIECWPLTEEPKELTDCRGFASGTKDPSICPANHPPEVAKQIPLQKMNVAAVMSVPRLGFQDNSMCADEALVALNIPIIRVQGAFWGQCLERGIQKLIDDGFDIILTVDYDTAFKRSDVEAILRIIHEHKEATAIVPVQRGRANMPMLMSLKTLTGQPRKGVPLTELQKSDTTVIATGHFGLTALRAKDLLDVPHPWFWDQPNGDNQWGSGRVDADIWFWRQLEKSGKRALLANRVTVGHMELMVRWPNEDMQPIYQVPADFHDQGKPQNIWK